MPAYCHVFISGFVKNGECQSSEFHCRKGHISVYVSVETLTSRQRSLCIGCTCPVGLAGIVNGVTTQKRRLPQADAQRQQDEQGL